MSNPIVVGVDGSQNSLRALEWAADEARRRHLPLRIVHIAVRWEYSAAAPPEPGLEAARPEEAGLRVLEVAEERAQTYAPEVDIRVKLGIGHVPSTLLEEASDAALMVVATRGISEFSPLLLGSVSRQVAEHAPCSVIVVPPESEPRPERSEIVVGVDGSQPAKEALDFAVEEAASRSARLHVIHSWTHPLYPEEIQPARYDKAAVEQEGKRLLSESLAGCRLKYPELEVREEVTQGSPAHALAEATHTATLTVVGTRGRGGFPGLHLGSVSHAVLHHAHGPVAIVRSRTTAR